MRTVDLWGPPVVGHVCRQIFKETVGARFFKLGHMMMMMMMYRFATTSFSTQRLNWLKILLNLLA